MNPEYRIESGEVEFILQFSFSKDSPINEQSEHLEPNESFISSITKSHYLEILVKRSDLNDPHHQSVNIVGSRSEIPVELEFDDSNNFSGMLSLYHDPDSGLHFVWGDVQCGPKYEKHFVGALSPIL